jgi:hypothetical protein
MLGSAMGWSPAVAIMIAGWRIACTAAPMAEVSPESRVLFDTEMFSAETPPICGRRPFAVGLEVDPQHQVGGEGHEAHVALLGPGVEVEGECGAGGC